MTHKFQHVEDYIEIIAGLRMPNGKKAHNAWNPKSPLSLARYDVNFVQSVAQQTFFTSANGAGMTDKQAFLAVKLIKTYKRQLAALGVDISPVEENPDYRNPLRFPDRSKTAYIKDEKIYLKFPYNVEMITKIREWAKGAQGSAVFDHDNKVWKFGLTEYNLYIAVGFAQQNGFEIAPDMMELYARVEAMTNSDWAIQLQINENGLQITNAEESLLTYIEKNYGGLHPENLLTLVNASGLHGYSVHTDILAAIEKEYGSTMSQIMQNREIKIDPSTTDPIKIIDEFATLTDAFPIYVYEQVSSDMWLDKYLEFYGRDGQVVMNVNGVGDVPQGTKVVWSNKTFKNLNNRIPLLVSHTGLPQVGYRSILSEKSNKIIYVVKHVFRAAAEDSTLSQVAELK